MATHTNPTAKVSKLDLLLNSPGEFAQKTGRWAWQRTRNLLGIRSRQANARNSHVWAIGVFTGPSPLQLKPSPDFKNPVLSRDQVTDISAAFVADPFGVQVGSTWYVFFEVLNHRYPPGMTDQPNPRGEIGLATSRDLKSWQYQQIVLAEPYHLSYPHIVEWEGEFYMIPESLRSRAVQLYKAVEFPTRWEKVGAILENDRFADTTLFRHEEKWWLFTETSPTGRNDMLRLYWADNLRGPWTEHPASPVVQANPHFARPAGSVVSHNGRLLRFAQDCEPDYGLRVHAFEILELTTRTYRERPAKPEPVLTGSGRGWNESGMHHVDAHRSADGTWWAFVDGWFAATASQWGGKE